MLAKQGEYDRVSVGFPGGVVHGIVHTAPRFYTPGVGHLHRNFWEASNGQNDMARLSELSGGESYFLGLHAPVSFKPYFENLQKNLDNHICWNSTRDLATEQAYNPSR